MTVRDMAGATNKQYKAAGLPRRSVDTLRVNGSAGMTVRSGIQLAAQHGAVVPEKARAILERRVAPREAAPKRGVLSRLPTRNGIYRVRLSALDSITTRNLDPSRKARVEAERVNGIKQPALRVTINAQGRAILSDGHHRLATARERGDKTIPVRFTVLRGKDSWAVKQEKRR